jgi:hypothetical protein
MAELIFRIEIPMTPQEKLSDALRETAVTSTAAALIDEVAQTTLSYVLKNGWPGLIPSRQHDARVAELLEANNREVARRRAAEAGDCLELYPLDSYHEDYGEVLWWKLPVEEAPYCGSPLADSWPGYHTHWSKVPKVWLQPVILERPKGACL